MLLQTPAPPADQILLAMEDCIDRYIAERRTRIEPFVEHHFSLQDTLALHKQSLAHDMLCYPVNMLWAIPYVFVKKLCETLDKLGWPPASTLLSHIPAGMKRRSQKHLESIIMKDLLQWPADGRWESHEGYGLLMDLRGDARLASLLPQPEFSHELDRAAADITRLVESYGSSRSLGSDLAGSCLTIATGWLVFGDHSLGVEGMGERLARRRAQEKAASSFFLGSGLGSMFYSVFPPKPTMWEVMLATAGVGLVLTVCGVLLGMLTDPLLKRLGLHRRQLHALVDAVEDRLHLLRRRVKPAIKQLGS